MPETVDIPLSGGLDLRDPRALPAGSFSVLDNADFYPGVKRRHGHIGYSVSDESLTGGFVQFAEAAFLYGHGLYDPSYPSSVGEAAPGEILGVATRGDEMLAWDGFRLLANNPTPGARWRRVGSVLPSGDTMDAYAVNATERTAIWRNQPTGSQRHYDMAVGRNYTAYVWIDGTTPKYSVTVNDTGHTIVSSKTLPTTSTSATITRVTYSENTQGAGSFFFTVNDSVSLDLFCVILDEARMRRYHIFGGYTPSEVTVSLNMVGATTPFDVRPASGGRVAYLLCEAAPQLRLTYVGVDLGTSTSLLSVVGAGVTSGPVGLAIHPDGSVLATWYWNDTGVLKVMSAFYNATGAIGLEAPVYVNEGTALSAAVTRVTCEFKYLSSAGSRYEGVVAWWESSTSIVAVREVSGSATSGSVRRLGDVQMTHQLVRVGQRTFLTVGFAPPGTLQWQMVVLAVEQVFSRTGLTPVVSVLRGGFIDDNTADGVVRSVAPWPSNNDPINPTRFSFINASGVPLPGIISVTQRENGAKVVDLDFLPKLRTLDRGTTTWIPGGVVREYDGATLAEVGFLTYPQPTLTAGAGGLLTVSTTYSYRVYLCSENAQGEVHRSAALTKQVTLSGGQNRVTLSLPPIPFCTKDFVYWEIYRSTAAATGQLQLLARTSPASLATARRIATSYVDDAADATILAAALDPSPAYTSSGFGLLDRVPPPSCEHLVSAKGRIWFHGGAVPPGQVAYTRLVDPNDAPAWNEALTVDIPGSGKITGLGLLNDVMVAFRTTQAYAFGGPGPDNLGQGAFDEPRLARPDIGCIGPDSVLALPFGLGFQSLGGYRALTPGLSIINLGQPLDTVLDASNPITASARSTASNQARFAVAGQSTYVLDYTDGDNPRWTRWTLPVNGFAELGGYVLVAPSMHPSMVYLESPDVFTDAGRGYTFNWTLGWLPLGAKLGWGRADWLLIAGEWRGPHTLTGKVDYNYGWKLQDNFKWKPSSVYSSAIDLDRVDVGPAEPVDVYGIDEGHMYYGDPYLIRRRFRTQRVSAFQLSLSDTGADGDSFMVSALTVVVRPAKGGQRMGAKNLS